MTSTIRQVTDSLGGSERRVDMLMASLRADQGDAITYFPAFCAKMIDALGPRVVTDQKGGSFRRHAVPTQVSISMGDLRFRASFVDGVIICEESHLVRGITLGSTQLTFPEWLSHLVDRLELEAEQSESTRAALEQLLA